MKINMNVLKGICMGTTSIVKGIIVGIIVGVAAISAISFATDIPEVHTSYSSGECVKVVNFIESDKYTCENFPHRYSRVWVK